MSLINLVNECMPGQGRESAPICRAQKLVVQQKRQAFMATAAGFLTELSKTVLHTQKD